MTSDRAPARHPGHRVRTSCRLCGGRELERVLELTPTPPANALVPAAALGEVQCCFPLDVYLCTGCGHAQLLDIIDPADLFSEYVYVAGTSPVNVAHFQRYAQEAAARAALRPSDLVVEIGSNDGTLLRFFKARGMRVVGVDPARDIAARATAEGMPTLPEFFTAELARRLRAEHGPAAIVCANNVCAHIDDLTGVMEGVRELIAPDGVFVFQVSYLLAIHRSTLFDLIYHEHLDYHRIGPLRAFFERLGMRLWDIERVEAQGGSLRGYVSLAERSDEVRPSVETLESKERAAGLDDPRVWRSFAQRIERTGLELTALIGGLRTAGRIVAGYGAPAKATTLMHHFGLGPKAIEFIVEDNPLKHGLYTPGLHVPVVETARLYDLRPDYVVVLAWNFADPIVARHTDFTEQGGRFIVPLPGLRVY